MQAIKNLLWILFGFVALTLLLQTWIASWPLSIAAAFVTYFALILVFGVSEIKKQIVSAMPENMTLLVVREEDFSQRDVEGFARLSAELQSLGFSPLADYTIKSSNGKETPVLARLFIHTQHKCFAEIGQAFPPNAPPLAIGSVIISSFDDENKRALRQMSTPPPSPSQSRATPLDSNPPIPDPTSRAASRDLETDDNIWTLATTDRPPDAILHVLRHPRKLVSRHPNASPRELLQIHLDKRGEMARVLGLRVDDDLSFPTFCRYCAQSGERLRRALEKKNAFVALWEWKMVGPQQMEWWGEYSPLARRAQAMAPIKTPRDNSSRDNT